MSAVLSKAATRAYYEAQAADGGATLNVSDEAREMARLVQEPDTTAADLAYSAELVARVNAEAHDATRMPGWFWFLAPLAFVGTVAASAVWPWSWA